MIQNILRVLISNFWVMIIGVINGFIFPKILTIEDYAIFQTFSLYISYVGMLHLGFPSGMFINYGGYEYNSIDKKQYKSEVKVLILILSIFTVLGMGSYIIYNNQMLLYISLSIIPINIVATYKALYQSWSRFRDYSLINTLIPTVISAVGLAYYYIFKDLTGVVKIQIHLIIYSLFSILLLIEFSKFTKGIVNNHLFSEKNFKTLRIGFAIAAGNFINALFQNIDKQFIKIFFDSYDFGIYSFGLAMQSIMTLFIIAIAQPLYPQLSSGKLSNKNLTQLKELLFVLGSISGSAFFACSLFVELFIPKYTESLSIIAIYFAIFPALAVINALYVNLYKVHRKTRRYIFTLSTILLVSIILNTVAVMIWRSKESIAAATTLMYYIWLIYSSKDFEQLKINNKDIIFLSCFALLYFIMIYYVKPIIGIILYPVIMGIVAFALYRDSISTLFVRIFSSREKKY